MQTRMNVSWRGQLVMTALSTSLLLACGDDADSTEEGADASDAATSDSTADKPSKTSAASKADAGSADDEASGGRRSEPDNEAARGGKGAADAGKPRADNAKPPAAEDTDAGAEPTVSKVSIRFQAKLGEADLTCAHKYASQGSENTTVTPRDARLFVHAVALLRADGSKTPLQLIPREPWQSETLALLDFEDNTGQCQGGSAETNTAITGTIEAGEYTGISFVVGVPEDLNHDAAAGAQPLASAGSLRAEGVNGYRFARFALGQLVAEGMPSGSGLFELSSVDCEEATADEPVKCGKPNRSEVTLDRFDAAKNSVVIDVAELFSRVDLTQEQRCSSNEESCAGMFEAFGVDFATGSPGRSQSVFRVE
jgi:uncharacterized repeat protein (TIGR04052 family)